MRRPPLGKAFGLVGGIALVGVSIILLAYRHQTGPAFWIGLGAIRYKLDGKAPHCSWGQILSLPFRYASVLHKLKAGSPMVLDRDEQAGIRRIRTVKGDLWTISEETEGHPLGVLISGHEDLAGAYRAWHVRRGDVVLDCGAHVGVFTLQAIAMGARKVVAIEPNPVALECLRRNLGDLISAGRVVLYPKGVWSSDAQLTIHMAAANSGHASLYPDAETEGGKSFVVPLTTIDKLVSELGIEGVDFMKLDIEGAEREALRGASETIRRFRPRIMIDTNHRDDDMAVLPEILLGYVPSYEYKCGECWLSNSKALIVPFTTFWRPRSPAPAAGD